MKKLIIAALIFTVLTSCTKEEDYECFLVKYEYTEQGRYEVSREEWSAPPTARVEYQEGVYDYREGRRYRTYIECSTN